MGSYLDIERLIKIAKEQEVDAIHPGYGFLSENAQLSRRCREEGIKFVGPPPEVIEVRCEEHPLYSAHGPSIGSGRSKLRHHSVLYGHGRAATMHTGDFPLQS